MRILEKITTVLLFLLFSTPSMAGIISVKIRSDNRNTILFSNDFGFTHTGHISIAISSVAVSSVSVTPNISQPDPSRIGFFLLSDEVQARYDHELERNPDLCALDSKFISVLFTFRDLSPRPHSSFNKSYPVTYPGVYSLYFANCNELSLVTMDIRTELYNTDDDGTTKDYLSAELTQLPSLYLKISLIYLSFLVFWISVCFKNQRYFHRMHLLMGMLLFMTFAYFVCAAENEHDMKVTGTPHGWDILFYIFQFIRNVFFSTLIVLIGAGLCFWKPYLQKKEILCLMIVILLQVWANVISIRIRESGPFNEDWMDWKGQFIIVILSCCITIHVSIICSALAPNEDPKTAARETEISMRSFISLIKKTCDKNSARPDPFFMLVTLYRFLQVTCPLLQEETITLLFSMVMFYMFRPFVRDDEDETCVCLLGSVLVI